MKTKLFTSLIALISLAFAGFAQQEDTTRKVNAMSLQQAVDYAKKNNVQVRNALLDYQIQQQSNREITASALPQISASGTVNYNPNVAVQSFPNFISAATYGVLQQEGVKNGSGQPIVSPADFGFVQAQFGTKYTASGGIDASQLLFDGQVFVGLQARKTSLQYATKQGEVTAEMINVNVQKVYYQLLVGKQQMTSIDANIDRFQRLLNDTKKIYEQGFAERLDVDKVTVQLNNLQTEKVKTQSQLDAGFAGLKFLLNMPQKDSLVLTDTITEDILKENILADEYKYEDRKEYQLLALGKKLSEYNVKRYKLSYLPTLSAFANYSKNAQRNEFNFFKGGPEGQWFTSSVVGLRLSVPIFDGFAKSARINQAKLQLQQVNNNMEQLRSSIDNDVVQARLQITAALTTVDNQRRNMDLAEKVYNSTKLKYEQGLGANQEIYTAQAELKVAQNNYYGALYDAVVAKIDYLKATGKLLY